MNIKRLIIFLFVLNTVNIFPSSKNKISFKVLDYTEHIKLENLDIKPGQMDLRSNPFCKNHDKLVVDEGFKNSKYYLFINTKDSTGEGEFTYLNEHKTIRQMINDNNNPAENRVVNVHSKNSEDTVIYFNSNLFGNRRDLFNHVTLNKNDTAQEIIKKIYTEVNNTLYKKLKKKDDTYTFNNFAVKYEGYTLENFYTALSNSDDKQIKDKTLFDFLTKFHAMIYVKYEKNAGDDRKIKIEETVQPPTQKKSFSWNTFFLGLGIGSVIFGIPLIILLYKKYYKK